MWEIDRDLEIGKVMSGGRGGVMGCERWMNSCNQRVKEKEKMKERKRSDKIVGDGYVCVCV